MKKIIVPIDFSEQSEYALKVATDLAKKHSSEILAIHMLELNQAMITSSEGFHPEQTVFLLKLAEKRFREFLNKPYLKGVSVRTLDFSEKEMEFVQVLQFITANHIYNNMLA